MQVLSGVCTMIRTPLSSAFQSLEPLPIEGWSWGLVGPHGGSPTAWASGADRTCFGPSCQQDNLAPARPRVNREPEALLRPVSGSSSATLSVGNPPSPVVVSSTGNPRHKCQTPRLPVPCSWDLLCTIQSGVSPDTGDSCAHFQTPIDFVAGPLLAIF